MSSGATVRPDPDPGQRDHYDVVVVGGGINGAGIARDAALRGMRVLLLEKADFGSGTSSWSSRLIHGGLRYLEYGEIPLVHESLRERRLLLTLAPHLVRQLRLCIPVYENSRRGRFIIRLGLLAYDLLSLGRRFPGHRMQSRAELMADEPGLASEGLVGGASYYDAQVAFVERLVLENVIGASEAGADVRNYSPVIGINVRNRRVERIQFLDRATGEETEVSASAVVNAAGPWVDRVLATVNREVPTYMGGTKGSHIVVGAFDGAPRSAFYVEASADGRPFFIIPWNGQYLIGTTDIRYAGDPADVQPDADEVRYLLDEANRVFPSAKLTTEDIHYAYAGVRPLPKREQGPESAITRKHIVLRHRRLARGLISIIGGKITTYRSLAEQAVDAVEKYAKGNFAACSTRDRPLPGGQSGGMPATGAGAAVSAACFERLQSIYGSRAEAVLALAADPSLAGFVDAAELVPRAEIAHAIRKEFAVTLIDIVHRRTMVGLDADQGRSMTRRIADAAARELHWSDREKERQVAALEAYDARQRV